MDEYIFRLVLEAREERVRKRNFLLASFTFPIITLSLNIPGPHKGEDIYKPVFNLLKDEIAGKLMGENIEILHEEYDRTVLGFEGFAVVRGDCRKVKLIGLELEKNHPLGQLFDIDVTDKDGSRISREDFDYPHRPCIVCGKESAVMCIAGRRHSLDETLEKIKEMIGAYRFI